MAQKIQTHFHVHYSLVVLTKVLLNRIILNMVQESVQDGPLIYVEVLVSGLVLFIEGLVLMLYIHNDGLEV